MQDTNTASAPTARAGRWRAIALRIAALTAFTLIGSALLPGLPILLGVLLILATALYAWVPEAQHYLQPVLRVPVGSLPRRRAHMLLVAGLGGLLLASGTVGATTRGHLRSRMEQDERRRSAAEQEAGTLIARARDQLERGNPQAAEMALMDAERVIDLTREHRLEIEQLLERIRLAGDAQAILEIVVALPQEDFETLEAGQQVPPQLEFPERMLTMRATELAVGQLAEARRRRAEGPTSAAPDA